MKCATCGKDDSKIKAQNKRLKKMLNDIRGRAFCASSDLAVEILRRIEDGTKFNDVSTDKI